MWNACDNVRNMAKMIQIRNVPESVHRTMKARAAQAGMSLSDYLLAEVNRLAELPTIDELTERIRRRTKVRLSESAAAIVRRHRNAG